MFADWKLYDIPATVGAAVRQLARSGASFLTVHGDRGVVEAAAAEKGERLKILAVTVLTSVAPSDLKDMGVDVPLEAFVEQRAKRAVARGRRRRDRVRPRGRATARGARPRPL